VLKPSWLVGDGITEDCYLFLNGVACEMRL